MCSMCEQQVLTKIEAETETVGLLVPLLFETDILV